MTPRGDTGESQRLTTEWWAKAWARVGLWSFHLLIGNTCGESVRSGSTGRGLSDQADFLFAPLPRVYCASRATEHRSITHLLTTIVKKPDFVFWDADYAYGKREESFGLPLVL